MIDPTFKQQNTTVVTSTVLQTLIWFAVIGAITTVAGVITAAYILINHL